MMAPRVGSDHHIDGTWRPRRRDMTICLLGNYLPLNKSAVSDEELSVCGDINETWW